MNSLFFVKYHFRNKDSNKKNLGVGNIFPLLYRILFLFLLLSSVSAESKEITSKYTLEMLGSKVGEFSVTQKNENGKLNIEAITDVKVKLLFSYRVKYVQNTVYEQGVLKHSNVKTYKNGKLNSDMMLKQEKDAYLLVVDGDTTLINDSITYSGSLLYFNEPLGIKQLYKERTAEMLSIALLSAHTYVVKDEKERELNRYIYKNGVLEYAKMRHALGTLELKRVSENTMND
ncbi:hypothetical protein GM418_23620 [Maribellus comscasis]|uniref:Uncharacterized protein n=1 Tax=Maribellus comscasis TaxID=2681766 RepID=A0A6I6JZG0_9BACT|nr:DUF6134 family protein [Maribellus comscasis]QGY46540.1 hypothetical protein GM418_23620 [Maribellus comscasis]